MKNKIASNIKIQVWLYAVLSLALALHFILFFIPFERDMTYILTIVAVLSWLALAVLILLYPKKPFMLRLFDAFFMFISSGSCYPLLFYYSYRNDLEDDKLKNRLLKITIFSFLFFCFSCGVFFLNALNFQIQY